MKIRGTVELYANYGAHDQRLVYADNNVVVDGAGEIIVDMLTTTPSLSSIPSASAILDTSNYTIQALTFGKDEKGYNRHAHTDTWSGIDFSYSEGASGAAADKDQLLFSGAMVFVSSHADRPSILATGSIGIGTSSYYPSGSPYNILPKFPSPMDTKLEDSSKTIFSDLSLTANNKYADRYPQPAADNIQAAFQKFENIGHNTNVLLSEVAAGFAPSGSDAPGLISLGLLQGAFPRGKQHVGTSGGIFTHVSQLSTGVGGGQDHRENGNVGNQDVSAVSALFVGNFNTVGSMDLSGYLGQVYNPYGAAASGFVVNGPAADGLGQGANIEYSGLVVSANADFKSKAEVIYTTMITSGDLGFTNLYGGIYNIGLWALDLKETLKTSAPPYAWDPYDNVRKYKLFSKKSFTKNLAYIQDVGGLTTVGLLNYKDLRLVWRLYF